MDRKLLRRDSPSTRNSQNTGGPFGDTLGRRFERIADPFNDTDREAWSQIRTPELVAACKAVLVENKKASEIAQRLRPRADGGA